MRLILFDCPTPHRRNFFPAALSRPIFELRLGMNSLGEKIVAKANAEKVAHFVPAYMAAAHQARTACPVNDAAMLHGNDLLLVNGRLKAETLEIAADAPSQVAADSSGEVLWARIAERDLGKLRTNSIDAILESAKATLPAADSSPATWSYLWELILANPAQLAADFAAANHHGIEGTVEEPRAIRGSATDVFVARGAVVHPMVVIDAQNGPVFVDEGAEIHPFTRIEGPCYVGKNSLLLGCKCRAGNSIGPMCRLGGEVEGTIVQGYSNKYHDGFLGHAYVGEWVNLGAMTTNSDLKNDYTAVSVTLDGKTPVNTGSTKIGSLIGDHAKTSIGTLLNTGAYVGAMTLIAADGGLLPKFLPSFGWFLKGTLSEGFGKARLYETAKAVMSRRGCEWTPADESLWNAVYDLTAEERQAAMRRNR